MRLERDGGKQCTQVLVPPQYHLRTCIQFKESLNSTSRCLGLHVLQLHLCALVAPQFSLSSVTHVAKSASTADITPTTTNSSTDCLCKTFPPYTNALPVNSVRTSPITEYKGCTDFRSEQLRTPTKLFVSCFKLIMWKIYHA